MDFAHCQTYDIPIEKINSCYQDSKGFVWLSYENLYRLDGNEIKKYVHNSDNSRAIQESFIQSNFFEDSLRNIWFCTTNYLYQYIRKKDCFESFQLLNEGQEEFEINIKETTGYRIIDLDKQGNLWMQISDNESGHLFKFNIHSKRWVEEKIEINGLEYATIFDTGGELTQIYASKWIYEGVEWINVKTKEQKLLHPEEFAMKSYREGSHTFFVTQKGFIQINPGGSSKAFTTPTNNWIRSIISKENIIQFLAGDKRYEFNPLTELIKEIGQEKEVLKEFSLKKKESLTLTSTGLSNQKIAKPFINFDLSEKVNHIFYRNKKKGPLYVGANSGRIYKDNKTIGQTGIYPYFVQAKSNVFIISNGGIFKERINNQGIQQVAEGNFVNPKACYYDNILHIFDANNYYQYDLEKNKIKIISNGFYRSIYLADSIIYAQGNNFTYEINLVLNEKDSFINKRIVTQINQTKDGELLFATDLGLQKQGLKKGIQEKFLLKDKTIKGFKSDSNEDYWVTTRNEIFLCKKNGDVYRFNNKNYLPDGLFFTEGAVLENETGQLKFGTNSGVLTIMPGNLPEEKYDVPVYIKSFKVNDHEWAKDTLNIEIQNEPVLLNYDENSLKFQISTIDFNPSNVAQFKTYLKGYDTDTIEWGDQSIISYPNLKPGEYTFYYSATNLMGVKRPQFEKLEIIINPPFWQTLWFKTLFTIGILFLIGVIIYNVIKTKLRKQQFIFEKQELILKNQLQLQEERNRIADELHDELGGKLSTIKFAGKRVQRANTIEEVKSINQRVSEISTELIESMRSIIWAMDSQNDNLNSLFAAIRQYAKTLARDNDLNIKVNFPEIEKEVTVKGQTRHHLFLVVKELLNNILKHSNADRISLSAEIKEEKLNFELIENGQGYNNDPNLSNGKGMKTIRKRMKTLNGKIHFEQNGQIRTNLEIPRIAGNLKA